MLHSTESFNSITSEFTCTLQTKGTLYNTVSPVQSDILYKLRTMTSDNDLVSELYRTLRLGQNFRNFMKLYNWYDGTEQLFTECVEREICAFLFYGIEGLECR